MIIMLFQDCLNKPPFKVNFNLIITCIILVIEIQKRERLSVN